MKMHHEFAPLCPTCAENDPKCTIFIFLRPTRVSGNSFVPHKKPPVSLSRPTRVSKKR